jgi:capsular polysaccharide transport system permease protein
MPDKKNSLHSSPLETIHLKLGKPMRSIKEQDETHLESPSVALVAGPVPQDRQRPAGTLEGIKAQGQSTLASGSEERSLSTTTPTPPGQISGEVLRLPQRSSRRTNSGIISFIACVVVPTLIAAIYYLFYASNQYLVTIHFAVKESQTLTSSSSNSGMTGGLSLLLGGGATQVSAENYIVTDYITSRQAVEDLQQRINLAQIYSRPQIDWLSRFDASLPTEALVRYWRSMTSASYDQITGISVATVKAFDPEDALRVATMVLELSENLVNEISRRPQREAVREVEQELKHAEDRLKDIRRKLTEYRGKEAIIDPNSSIVAGNATLSTGLRTTLAQLQTELATMQQLSANAPQVQALRTRIKAIENQLNAIEGNVKSANSDRPLSDIVGRYEELDLERQFAQTAVISAMQNLDRAKSALAATHSFLIPYVRPSLPESSLYPNRLLAISIVAGACFLLWAIGLLVARSIQEHLA